MKAHFNVTSNLLNDYIKIYGGCLFFFSLKFFVQVFWKYWIFEYTLKYHWNDGISFCKKRRLSSSMTYIMSTKHPCFWVTRPRHERQNKDVFIHRPCRNDYHWLAASRPICLNSTGFKTPEILVDRHAMQKCHE